MKIDGRVVNITMKLWNEEGDSIEFESYDEEDDYRLTMADPRYISQKLLVEANSGSENCHGCGAPVKGGRGYCPYCGRVYKGAYK